MNQLQVLERLIEVLTDTQCSVYVSVTCIGTSHRSPDTIDTQCTLYLLHVLEHLIEVLTVMQCTMYLLHV